MCDKPRQYRPMTIAIRKVRDPFGWMGNMSPHGVYWAGVTFATAEALFQRRRFPLLWQHMGELSSEKNPMKAKMIAKKYASEMIVTPCSDEDVNNMIITVEAKLIQNRLLPLLLATGDAFIVEDCTNRPKGNGLFWGARRVSAFEWDGKNMLGNILMDLRKKHGGYGAPT